MRIANVSAGCLLLALAACSDPPPPADEPPDPQAGAVAPAASDHTELRDTINEPLDRARDARAAEEAGEAERQQALDAAGG